MKEILDYENSKYNKDGRKVDTDNEDSVQSLAKLASRKEVKELRKDLSKIEKKMMKDQGNHDYREDWNNRVDKFIEDTGLDKTVPKNKKYDGEYYKPLMDIAQGNYDQLLK